MKLLKMRLKLGVAKALHLDLLEETTASNSWVNSKNIDRNGCIRCEVTLPPIFANFNIEKELILTNESDITLYLYVEEYSSQPPGFKVIIEKSILLPREHIRIKLRFSSELLGEHNLHFNLRGEQKIDGISIEGRFEVLRLRASVVVELPRIGLSKAIIDIPEPLIMAETKCFLVEVSNPSPICPIKFLWTRVPESAIDTPKAAIRFHPEADQLSPMERRSVKVSLTPLELGEHEFTVLCTPQGSVGDTSALRIPCRVVSPSVEINKDCLNFGVLNLQGSLSDSIQLRNPSSISLEWFSQLHQEKESPFIITPWSGVIRGKQTQLVKILFHPQKLGAFDEEVKFCVRGAPSRTLRLIGESQNANVSVNPSEILLENVCINNATIFNVTLTNSSPVPAKFQWLCFESPEEEDCVRVNTSPSRGRIGPNADVNIQVAMTTTALGNIFDYTLYCKVDGIEKPLELKVSVNVVGLTCKIGVVSNKIHLQTYDNVESIFLSNRIFEADGPTIQFPQMGLWKPQDAYLVVENTSGIHGAFSLSLEHFQLKGANFNCENWKTKDFWKDFFKTNKPFVVLFNPPASKIDLPPYQKRVVGLIGCADIFGEFRDTLVVKIEARRDHGSASRPLVARLPLITKAVGCPIDFLAAVQPRIDERLVIQTTAHLGVVSNNSGTREREVKLRNNSSFSVKIDWHLYNRECPNETRLLDLCAIVNTSDPKRQISLLLRPHEGSIISRSQTTARRLLETGKCSKTTGISISPLQTTIDPHGEASVFVKIDAAASSSDQKSIIDAYAEGFVTVENVGDHVRLPDPLLCPMLRINIRGRIAQPEVYVEWGDEPLCKLKISNEREETPKNPIHFNLRADDFLMPSMTAEDDQIILFETSTKSSRFAERVLCLRRLKLSNFSAYPVCVNMAVLTGENFVFLQDETCLQNAKRGRIDFLAKSIEKHDIAVPANDSQIVLLGFMCGKNDLSGSQSAENEISRFGKLKCALDNSEEVEIDLEGCLRLPQLCISTLSPVIHLPDTFPTETSSITLKITNLGLSGTRWVLKSRKAESAQEPCTFNISPLQGTLFAKGDPFLRNSSQVIVQFSPKKPEEYAEDIEVVDALTKKSIKLKLRGVGIVKHLPKFP